MVDTARVKIYEYKGRHSINLPSEFVNDSTFPFRPNEDLVARIDGSKIIFQKAGRRGSGRISP
jgi:hypothetical protein